MAEEKMIETDENIAGDDGAQNKITENNEENNTINNSFQEKVSAASKVVRGADGIYRTVDEVAANAELFGSAGNESSYAASDAARSNGNANTTPVDSDPATSNDTTIVDASLKGGARGVTIVSSSSGVGADVAAKRLNLVNAKGEPKLGRREPPEPYDPWPKRKMIIRGLALGFVVVAVVLILILALSLNHSVI